MYMSDKKGDPRTSTHVSKGLYYCSTGGASSTDRDRWGIPGAGKLFLDQR
jgi:hypothetical protein